jgi:hypothetical protein
LGLLLLIRDLSRRRRLRLAHGVAVAWTAGLGSDTINDFATASCSRICTAACVGCDSALFDGVNAGLGASSDELVICELFVFSPRKGIRCRQGESVEAGRGVCVSMLDSLSGHEDRS